ncbi:MAG TPA: J domain-containing protein [Chloroflexota bacterium]|nr:J domain-containing protein [Chloroflexota bacterium]
MATETDTLAAQNHYDVLGLERGAPPEAVKNAFRLRSHMFHPDKYENYSEPLRTQLKGEAAREFKKLTAAYEVLRDPAKRAAHDRQLDAGERAYGRGGRARRPAPARATRATAAAEPARPRRPSPPPPPRERDPLLVVRPDRLDFGIMALGATKQLPIKISNAGGRTLFGEITSNRSWLSVNRRTFISSAAVIFASVDTTGLRPGEEYSGNLVVSTLNGGDQVVPVYARVSGRPEPILTGAPSLLDFGVAQRAGRKARTVKLANAGTGTLIGSVAVKGGWLSVTEGRFKGNDVAFEVIANTTGLEAGEHQGEVVIFSNGGQATIQVLVEVAVPPPGEAIVSPDPERAPAGAPSWAGAGGSPPGPSTPRGGGADGQPSGPSPATLSPEAQRDLLRRVMSVEPETVWERDFLRRVVQLVRAGERLAPGELAKIYELEARVQRGAPPS